MARGRKRPERRPGRQEREAVPARLDDDWFGLDETDDDDVGGSAGVREPRHPKPVGPMSGAGAKPLPEEFVHLVLTG